MTAADFAPLMQALIAAIGVVMTSLIGIYVPRAIAAFERRTGVAVTDQERAAVMGAVTTAAGLIQTKFDQGLLKTANVSPSNGLVLTEAAAAMARVSDSAASQRVTTETAAMMIAARVDTSRPPLAGG